MTAQAWMHRAGEPVGAGIDDIVAAWLGGVLGDHTALRLLRVPIDLAKLRTHLHAVTAAHLTGEYTAELDRARAAGYPLDKFAIARHLVAVAYRPARAGTCDPSQWPWAAQSSSGPPAR